MLYGTCCISAVQCTACIENRIRTNWRIVAMDWCTSARLKQALLLRGRMKDRHGYVHKMPRTVHCMPSALGQSRVCEVLNHGVRSTSVSYCFR